MKIVIDSGALSGGHAVRGIGFYTKHLIDALNRVTHGSKVTIDSFDLNANPSALHTKKYDIVHYPYFDIFFHTLRISKPQKTVVTIHDVIPLLYPKHYPPGLRGRLRLLLQKYSLRSVSAVITDTEASKKDIVRFLSVPQEKIYPIHLASADEYGPVSNKVTLSRIRKKYKLPQNFILYVGDVNYNKNIVNLIKASRLARLPLILVGKAALAIDEPAMSLKAIKGPRDWLRYLTGSTHPELSHNRKLARAFKRREIKRLGFVPTEDLKVIYNLASVYCFPSLAEGFGLSVLEAMKCGCPVVCARAQALVEIADGAALFADPLDPSDIADKIKKAITQSQAEKLKKLGYNHAKKFSWNETAQKTLKVYEKVARLSI